MSDKVRLEQERSSTRVTLEVTVTVVYVPLMQQETLLTSKFRRAFRTPEKCIETILRSGFSTAN